MFPSIITLIGSSKFVDYHTSLAWEIEKRSIIAFSLHWIIAAPGSPLYGVATIEDHLAEHEGVADIMDELYLRKLDLADEVVLLAIDGYVGESTAREIKYCKSIGVLVTRVENWQQCEEYLLIIDEMAKDLG